MNLIVLLLILLLVFGGASFPAWPHSANWGYGPFGGIVSLILILIILRVFGII